MQLAVFSDMKKYPTSSLQLLYVCLESKLLTSSEVSLSSTWTLLQLVVYVRILTATSVDETVLKTDILFTLYFSWTFSVLSFILFYGVESFILLICSMETTIADVRYNHRCPASILAFTGYFISFHYHFFLSLLLYSFFPSVLFCFIFYCCFHVSCILFLLLLSQFFLPSIRLTLSFQVFRGFSVFSSISFQRT